MAKFQQNPNNPDSKRLSQQTANYLAANDFLLIGSPEAADITVPDVATNAHTAINETVGDGRYAPIASNILQRVKVHLTSAQILTIDSIPVTLIASPGTGKFLDIVSYVAHYNFLTTPYGGSGLITLSAASSGNVGSLDITSVTSTLSHVIITAGNGSVNDVTENTGLVAGSGSANTGGAGSVDLYITYGIVTL